MVKRWCAWQVLLLAGLLGCGEHVQPKMESAEDYVPGDIEVALANTLHRRHLKEVEPPASCTDCHRIGDKETNPPISDRCVRCHQEHRPTIHAKLQVPEGRQCLVCHAFSPKVEVQPACVDCHTAPGRPEPEWSTAPRIPIHAKEKCAQCHTVHGPQPPPVRPCLECHEQMGVLHDSGAEGDHRACLTCHGPHEQAARARARCTECHGEKLPKSATFPGHDACLKCHTPHPSLSKSGARVKACGACHTEVHAFGAEKVPEHERCKSCHDQHRVRTSPLTACVRCHTTVEPQHPAPDFGGRCVGCHPGHPDEAHTTRTQPCSACHDKAKGDTAWHAGNLTCMTCHQQHTFDLSGRGSQLCKGCHVVGAEGQAPSAQKRVAPNKGHGNCVACHEQGPHAPAAATAGCTSSGCHQAQGSTAPEGHAACRDCHLPHEGKVKKACIDCHVDRGRGSHAEPAKDCAQCHRPHGPGGPEQVKPCRTCHTEVGKGMHQHPEHQRCQDCHGFHGQARRSGSRRSCTSTCHVDEVQHEPSAVDCVGCHPFVL